MYTASEPLNVRDSTGATALHAAVRHGQIECAKFLATTGNIDVLARDHVGGTPAHHAAYHGQLESLQWLFEHSNKSLDVVSPAATDGGTPLHFAAAMGWLGCLQWLVKICGNADIRDGKGTTPLYFAAQEGHTDCVRWLTGKARANPMAQAEDGMCASHAAAQAGRLECLRFLLMRCSVRASSLRDGVRVCLWNAVTPLFPFTFSLSLPPSSRFVLKCWWLCLGCLRTRTLVRACVCVSVSLFMCLCVYLFMCMCSSGAFDHERVAHTLKQHRA